jgi:hypothetical protein
MYRVLSAFYNYLFSERPFWILLLIFGYQKYANKVKNGTLFIQKSILKETCDSKENTTPKMKLVEREGEKRK